VEKPNVVDLAETLKEKSKSPFEQQPDGPAIDSALPTRQLKPNVTPMQSIPEEFVAQCERATT